MDISNKIHRASEYVRNAHQHRIKTTVAGIKLPQAEHLQEVADLVWISGGTEDETAAAFLHDSVEDTTTTLEYIKEHFGDNVAKIVDGLTDPEHFEGMPLPKRKRLQAERLQSKSESIRRRRISLGLKILYGSKKRKNLTN